MVEPQKIESNRERIRLTSFSFSNEQEANRESIRLTSFSFSNEQEAHLLRKGGAKKLSSWSFRSVAIGASILTSYGVTVFVIQLFFMSQNL